MLFRSLPKLIEDTKKWATELGKVAKQMKAIGDAQGGGGSSYIKGAGELTGGGGGGNTNVGSGNSPVINKIVNIHEAAGGGGGAGAVGKASPWKAIADLANAAIGAMDARAARGAQYSLSADKMNMLYQQTTGLSQNQVYHKYREPLQPYKLGMGGINELLGLQARTG